MDEEGVAGGQFKGAGTPAGGVLISGISKSNPVTPKVKFNRKLRETFDEHPQYKAGLIDYSDIGIPQLNFQ